MSSTSAFAQLLLQSVITMDIAMCFLGMVAIVIGYKEIEKHIEPQLPEGGSNPFFVPCAFSLFSLV